MRRGTASSDQRFDREVGPKRAFEVARNQQFNFREADFQAQ